MSFPCQKLILSRDWSAGQQYKHRRWESIEGFLSGGFLSGSMYYKVTNQKEPAKPRGLVGCIQILQLGD